MLESSSSIKKHVEIVELPRPDEGSISGTSVRNIALNISLKDALSIASLYANINGDDDICLEKINYG